MLYGIILVGAAFAVGTLGYRRLGRHVNSRPADLRRAGDEPGREVPRTHVSRTPLL